MLLMLLPTDLLSALMEPLAIAAWATHASCSLGAQCLILVFSWNLVPAKESAVSELLVVER